MKKRMHLAILLFYAIFLTGCLGGSGGSGATSENVAAVKDLDGVIINQSADAGNAIASNATHSEDLDGILVSEIITLDTTAAPAPSFAATPGATAKIQAPGGLKPVSVTETAIQLIWARVLNAATYNVYINSRLIKSGVISTSVKIENLAPLTIYAIQISSVAATGESPLSPAVQVRTVLFPPKNIKPASVTDTTIELAWDKEPGALAYNIFVNSRIFKSGITSNSFKLESLKASTAYSLQVASTCAKGSSALSQGIVIKTLMSVPETNITTKTGTQKFNFIDNKNGTVTDFNTGLTWQKSPDTNGDGSIKASDKLTWSQAQARPAFLNAVNYGGYNDWRLPGIKELYSLLKYSGIDPSGYTGTSTAGLTPYIDTTYFLFAYGDTAAGERIIDSQYASSTLYVDATASNSGKLFGVNFADGRIKGYDLTLPGKTDKTFFVQCVRGNASYGVNHFIDNGNGTITDSSTGLMWSKTDSGTGMNWSSAAGWVASKNTAKYLGYSDWRLADIKELQSIVDYTRSPGTNGSAAINPVFKTTSIKNEAGQTDYPYFWSCTEHSPGSSDANYIAFGRALGYMNGKWQDVHGAGAQRSDPKFGSASSYPTGHGPQGDAIRINNFVRLVRSVSAK